MEKELSWFEDQILISFLPQSPMAGLSPSQNAVENGETLMVYQHGFHINNVIIHFIYLVQ